MSRIWWVRGKSYSIFQKEFLSLREDSDGSSAATYRLATGEVIKAHEANLSIGSSI